MINDLLLILRDEWILKTPTLLALIPSDRYENIREEYLTRPGYEYVLEELDEYHYIQTTVKDRMVSMHEKYGTDFYFIAGYDLGLGEGSDDFWYFKFLNSANKVNSDEVINIESTTLGAESVPAHSEFPEEYTVSVTNKKYISPENNVDLSTALFPERCWLFEGQCHDLKWNNTAIRLAIDIAEGKIDCVNDAPDVYPQFNSARDISDIENDISDLRVYVNNYERHNILGRNVSCEKGFENPFNDKIDDGEDESALKYSENVKAGEVLLAEYKELKYETHNDPERDAEFLNRVRDFLKDTGLKNKDEDPSKALVYAASFADRLDDLVYSKIGPKGFLDLLF